MSHFIFLFILKRFFELKSLLLGVFFCKNAFKPSLRPFFRGVSICFYKIYTFLSTCSSWLENRQLACLIPSFQILFLVKNSCLADSGYTSKIILLAVMHQNLVSISFWSADRDFECFRSQGRLVLMFKEKTKSVHI